MRLKRADADPLRVFAANPGETLSRHALSERLGGGSRRVIDVQIAKLRRKIEPEPQNPRYLQTAGAEAMYCGPIEPRRPPGERLP